MPSIIIIFKLIFIGLFFAAMLIIFYKLAKNNGICDTHVRLIDACKSESDEIKEFVLKFSDKELEKVWKIF